MWSFTYDSYKRLLTKVDPLSRTTTYVYGATSPGNRSPVQVTDPSGKVTTVTYLLYDQYKASQTVAAFGTADAATTTFAFDNVANVTGATDPRGKTSLRSYDARNRVSWAKDPAGNETSFSYDPAGNVLTQTTPDGATTGVYDAADRLAQSTDPKGQVSKFTYDAEDEVATYTDPNNNAYQYTYDKDERQTAMQYPDGTAEQSAYDPAGNLTQFTNRAGHVKTLAYDARNRNSGVGWDDGITPAVTIAYDDASRISSVANSASTIGYTYNDAGEVLTETETVGGRAAAFAYTYNPNGTVATQTYPDGTALGYDYNSRQQVTAVHQGTTTVASYTYDAAGNRTGRTLANGVATTLAYDDVERLASLTDLTPTPTANTVLQSFQYGYDAMSRKTWAKRQDGLGDVYGYDTAGQLGSVQYDAETPDTAPASPARTVTYGYDAAGNRATVDDSAAVVTSYTVDPVNRYLAVAGASLSYDGTGNLTAYNAKTFSYDAENRLVQATAAAATVALAYDPLGRCVQRTENGVTTTFAFGLGWDIAAEYDALGVQQARYVHGPATDEILTKTDGAGTAVYYSTDGQGNFTRLTDATGAPVEQYRYDVYGAVTIEDPSGTVLPASAWNNRFLYTGREYLASVGLYDLRNRVYSPDLGRFLQPDPIGHAGDGYNLYRYCGNDPVNGSDPEGTDDGGLGDVGFSFNLSGSALSNFYLDGMSGGNLDVGGINMSWAQLVANIGTGSITISGPLGSSLSQALVSGAIPWRLLYPDLWNERHGPQPLETRTGGSAGTGQSMSGIASFAGAVSNIANVAALVPGLNVPASIVGAVANVVQGNYGEAGLSIAGVIPFGAVAIKGVRVGRAVLRSVDELSAAARAADRGGG